jgi:hypothetical protein
VVIPTVLGILLTRQTGKYLSILICFCSNYMSEIYKNPIQLKKVCV